MGAPPSMQRSFFNYILITNGAYHGTLGWRKNLPPPTTHIRDPSPSRAAGRGLGGTPPPPAAPAAGRASRSRRDAPPGPPGARRVRT
eukprot:4184168-Prymnesium_polylepis.1